MAEPVRFTMTCRLCTFHRTVSISGTVRPGMSQAEATVAITEQTVRAEDNFFRDHWQRAHPAEAAEIEHHIQQVAKLTRLTSYHKRVLETLVENAEIPIEGAVTDPNVPSSPG
jgi:hypothetical protein